MTDIHFSFKEKQISKPSLADITTRMSSYFGDNSFISSFFTQINISDEDGNFLDPEALLRSDYVKNIMGGNTLDKLPAYRKLNGFEVEGCLANILFEGGCHNNFVSNYLEAGELSKKCISEIYQEWLPNLDAYYFDESWNSWFIGEGIIDKTMLVFCPGRQFWWLLCLTETD